MVLRRNRTFRSLWLGQVVSIVGDGVQRIALLWWGAQQGGARTLTVLALCTMVPAIVVGPYAGVLADRYDRRRLMIWSDLASALACVGLAALLLGADPGLWVVGPAVALATTVSAFFEPSYAASVPAVVDDADLPEANGLNMANSAAGSLLGPLLGGLALVVWSPGWIVAANGLTFLWSALLVSRVRIPSPVVSAAAAPAVGEPRPALVDRIRGAVAGVPRDLVGLLGLAGMLNMVVAPAPILLVSLAVDRMGLGAGGLGALQMCLGAGLLAGSVAAKWLARDLAVSFVTVGACLAALGSVPLAVTFVLSFGMGVAVAAANTALITRFQRQVPPEAHGRVFGVVGAMSEGLRPIGVLFAGPLLAGPGVQGAFAVIGGIVILSTLVWWARSGRRVAVGAPAVTSADADVAATA